MKITKNNVVYVIYTMPMNTTAEKVVQDIPHQYHVYKDIFEKKNIGLLPDHRPYDCAIKL